jgi:predicted Zn-ribbon and HTH transcriptional regulator
MKKFSHEDFIEKVKLAQEDKITILSTYNSMKNKVDTICNKCGYASARYPEHLVSGHGCINCYGKAKLNTETFKQKMLKLPEGFQYTLLSEYKKDGEDVLMRHTCGEEFYVRPNHFVSSGSRCPRCKRESHGEKIIREELEGLNVDFETQYSFPDCKNKKELKFDFVLFDEFGDITSLIEFDGEQHYKSLELFGGQKNFEYMKKNDSIKTKYCKKNKYKLIRIRDKDLKNLKKIISKAI